MKTVIILQKKNQVLINFATDKNWKFKDMIWIFIVGIYVPDQRKFGILRKVEVLDKVGRTQIVWKKAESEEEEKDISHIEKYGFG